MIKKMVSKDTKETVEVIETTTTNFEKVWKFVEGSKEFKADREAFEHIFARIIGYYFVNTEGGMFLMGPDAVSKFFEEE